MLDSMKITNLLIFVVVVLLAPVALCIGGFLLGLWFSFNLVYTISGLRK